jgi:hypothetical protein
VAEDWAAVGAAIDARVHELGWRQRELAERSQVSQAIVRELQHHTVERRRSARTLESLSTTLGWHPQHLDAVLNGHKPPEPTEPPVHQGDSLAARLDRLEGRLDVITDRLDELKTDLSAVINHVRKSR